MKPVVTSLVACAVVIFAGRARADVSSWVFVGSGVSTFAQRGLERRADPTLNIETGIGTPASLPFIVGGMVKFQTLFGDGTDLGLALRGATQGFVTGRFGLAIDAGGYRRAWGEGSSGGQAALVLGAPWGITLSLGGGVGTHDARSFGATLGVDFARLTVYRLSGESWFPNPRPAYRPND
jgi:hypothetical protein